MEGAPERVVSRCGQPRAVRATESVHGCDQLGEERNLGQQVNSQFWDPVR